MFVPGNQPVVWRGPMLHRAPVAVPRRRLLGTSTYCSSTCRRDRRCRDLGRPAHPGAEIPSSRHPSRRRRRWPSAPVSIALQTHQRVAGVIENMSWLEPPTAHARRSSAAVAVRPSRTRSPAPSGAEVSLLGQIPLDTTLRIGADEDMPVVLGQPDSPAAVAPAGSLWGLAGRSLSSPPPG